MYPGSLYDTRQLLAFCSIRVRKFIAEKMELTLSQDKVRVSEAKIFSNNNSSLVRRFILWEIQQVGVEKLKFWIKKCLRPPRDGAILCVFIHVSSYVLLFFSNLDENFY